MRNPAPGMLSTMKVGLPATSKSRDKANLIVFITPTIVGDTDFQLATGSGPEFLQSKMNKVPESKESFWDSAKPYDWTKPNTDAPAESGVTALPVK